MYLFLTLRGFSHAITEGVAIVSQVLKTMVTYVLDSSFYQPTFVLLLDFYLAINIILFLKRVRSSLGSVPMQSRQLANSRQPAAS